MTALERIEEQHVPIIRKRHSMLPKGAGPDVEKTCSRCSHTPWPCDVVKLARALDDVLSRWKTILRDDDQAAMDRAKRTLEEVAE